MGKYMMRKCKRKGESAAMELAEASEGATKRRRAGLGGRELKLTAPCVQFQSRRRGTQENLGSAANSRDWSEISHLDRCTSSTSDRVPESCCSINESSQLVKEREKFADPDQVFNFGSSSPQDDEGVETETSTYYRESELGAESDVDMESTAKNPSDANSRSRSTVQMKKKKKKPSDAELDDFFAAANKACQEVQKEMSEKYNFDFESCAPLEGRLEWIPINK